MLAVAVAGPLDPPDASPVADMALASPPVAVPFVMLVALDPESDTVPDPVAESGAFTVVLPTVALLV